MQLKVQDILVGSRRAELAAVRDGFCAAAHLQPQLEVLTASDLALIMHGLEHITPADVLATIRFEEGNFPSECALPAMLEAVVRAMDEPMLRQLLLFVTGEPSIPIGGAYWMRGSLTRACISVSFMLHTRTGLRNPNAHAAHPKHITIARSLGGEESLPTAHVCTYTMDVPEYSSERLLSEKLRTALELFESQGFALA